MIKNQWYAIMSSKQIPRGKVVAARRFGEDLIFFRNQSGTLGCVSHKCAHRGASLSKGCLLDGNIRCPFHGIEYDVNGKCVYIPSEGRASKADYSRFNMKSYRIREIGDIVFAWYGEGEPDREPDYFDVITDKRYSYDQIDDMWKVHYSRVIENQLDVSHLAFVHRTTIGRGDKRLVNGPKVVWKDENTLQTSANNEVDAGQHPKTANECEIRKTNLNFKFPNMWLNHVTDKLLILAYFVPMDEEHSIISLRFYNRFTGAHAVDKLIARFGSIANIVVERQDKRIVETQMPKASAHGMKENLVAADRPIMEYRSRREELQRGEEQSSKLQPQVQPSPNGPVVKEEERQAAVSDAVKQKTRDGAVKEGQGVEERAEDAQTHWHCRVCGFEFIGDKLPEDYKCPVCGHPASYFER